MIKIVALNNGEEEINEDEENIVTREAQETIAENEYIRAIKLKSDGDIDLCLHLLKELLQTQVLNENIKNNRNVKLWIIKYNCHKNIALILEERLEYMQALQHYISAILIDSTDVSTLYKFGQLALKLNATDLAEYAFESCLSRNSSHWCAAEGMLQVMSENHNIIGLYSCASKICEENISNENAAQTLKEITNLFRQNATFLSKCSGVDSNSLSAEKYENNFNCLLQEQRASINNGERSYDQIPDINKFVIKDASWYSMGRFVLSVYSFLNEIALDMPFMFNLNDFIGNSTDTNISETEKDLPDTKTVNVENTQFDAVQFDSFLKCDEDVMDRSKILVTEKAEPQPLEYNNYDSDSNLKFDGYEANKTKPRRRCSDLHFLEQWGWHKNRRYSSRKKNERDDLDTSLNGYLQKILMKYTKLSIKDKWPFTDIPGTKSNLDKGCYECKIHLSDGEFNLKSRKEFEKFTSKLKENDIDLMQLAYRWLKYISLTWCLVMPEKLKGLYTDVFKIYITHFNFSTWNQLSPANYEASYRICVFYLELSIRNHKWDNSDVWRNVFYHLLYNIGNCHIISACNFKIYQLKLIYLEYLMLNKEHRYEDCLSCLKQIHEILEQQESAYILHLPNLDDVCMNISHIENLQLKYKRQIDINNIPKFYEDGLWDKLANIIILNMQSSENKHDDECWLKDFCAQIKILLHSLWTMESYENCLIWSEKCLHFAVSHYLQESKTLNRCTLLSEIINFVTSYIEAIILNEGFHFVVALKKENLCRLVQNLIRILVYQLDGTFEKNSNHGRELNFKRPWVILHQLILRDEHDSSNTLLAENNETQNINEMIPKSFLMLFTAHEYLGKRQWCTNDNGEFLQYVLDAVVLNLKAPVYDTCRDIIYEYLEQVTYCLFKYPQKKARLRHLEDHEASQIQLCWPNAVQVFDLYRPEDLPEFNSYKLESITSDMEQLLLKVISLLPKELDPSKSVYQVTMFIEGRLKSPPRDLNSSRLPYKILSLYYLLADFYFKNRDFVKAIKFYTLDLTVNPTRFDSWAGMALSKASKIETKLNGLDPISMESIWEECEEVLRCFECCINLNRFQTLLWIEYGSFSYTIHSCFSRYIKCNSQNICAESFSTINERKNKMLTIAYNCFSLVNSLQNSLTGGSSEDNSDSNDEKWLCQYMLGKISEKRREEPKMYLNHYLMAANYLYESSATYPIKINHSNPTLLSVEALEVFYRINAAIMKYLQNGMEISRDTGDLFIKVLKSLSNSPFAYNKAKIDGNSLNIIKGKHKFKPPLSYVLKTAERSLPGDKTSVNESMKNINSEELHETKENEKNSELPTKDFFYTSTSAIVASSGSTSVISSDTSTVESESESDDSITDNENSIQINGEVFNAEELKVVYGMVVQNIEECATRFPEHYKSIYRLIYHYMNAPADYRDLALSEQLLFGQYKTSLGNLVNGLFYDRKNNNLFNGIWRIPSSEIDRPGSFAAHLVKCVKICIQLLLATKNHNILVDIAINLYKTPDLDKRYITDAERKYLCRKSINYSIQILRTIFEKNFDKRDDSETLNLLLDIYKIHKKCVKYMNHKEPIFAELLIDIYKFFIKNKVECIPENCNFLDLAIKLCVQEITAQKIMEKSVHTDGSTDTTNTSSEISNLTSSRLLHIPGLNARPKFRGSTLKTSTETITEAATNSSMQNSLSLQPTDFTKNKQLLSTFGNGRDTFEFNNFFEEFYSKMLHSELNICSTTGLIQQKPINHAENQTTLKVSNPMSLILPYTPATLSTSEVSIFGIKSNIDEENDRLLQNQFNSGFWKQHTKPKLSYKNKSIFKPYNRSVQCESNHNAANDADGCSKLEIDILNKHINVLSAYSNLLQNTTLPQNDFGNKNLVATPKKSVDHLASISNNSLSNMDIKDYHNDAAPFKYTMASSRISTTNQIGNEFPNQQSRNSSNVISPIKTLQEKLAERQKAYQLNETMSSLTTKDNSYDDVIILD